MTHVLDFRGPDAGPVEVVLGDALRITGTPAASRAEAYIYRFTVDGVKFAEFWVTGISLETGGGPDKDYVIPDAILELMGERDAVAVVVEQRYRYIYLPAETDRVMGTRTLNLRVTDTAVSVMELDESAETQGIRARFGSFVQSRSRAAVRITASAPNGSAISRVDIFDGDGTAGERLGGLVLTPGTSHLDARLIPEDGPVTRHGDQWRTVVITDARGRKVVRTLPMAALRYAAPVVVRLRLRRAEEDGTPSAAGPRVLAQVEAAVQSLIVGGAERNAIQMRFRYRQVAGADPSWYEAVVNPQALSVDEEMLLPTAVRCNLDTNYLFELVLSDWFMSVVRTSLISTSSAMLSLHGTGSGVAIGKRATDHGLFDVALPARFTGGAEFHAPALFAAGIELGAPLPPESGGTGAASLDELKEALNVASGPLVQRGSYAFTLAASASAVTHTVYYPQAYQAAPTVLLQLQLITTFNVVTYALSYVGASYFQFQVTNGNTVQKSCTMHWTSVG